MNIYQHRLNTQQLPDSIQAMIANIITQHQADHHYLELDYDTRQRSRFKATTQSGKQVGIDLERTQTIKQGNILATTEVADSLKKFLDEPKLLDEAKRLDETMSAENSQAQPSTKSTTDSGVTGSHSALQADFQATLKKDLQAGIIQVLAKPQTLTQVTCADTFLLMRAAYHLGNRHVPLMVTPEALYFEPDHVLSDMLVGLGVTVGQVEVGFEPETGAYSQHGQHSRHHDHSHQHHHNHKNSHSHTHSHHHH